MNHELSDLMAIEQPAAAPACCPLDTANLRPDLDFLHWWQRAAELVGLPLIAARGPGDVSVAGVGLAAVLKRLNELDIPRRALLLTMVSLGLPHSGHWITREHGLHFGHLAACRLDGEVFQVLVGLLANYREKGLEQ
jgi:hypothetical protein